MLKRLIPNEDGATVVEFALLLPVIFGSFLGVLQAGIGMLTYNSLRNLSAETSRATLVKYQNSETMTLEEVELDAKNRAAGMGLAAKRFTIDVTKPVKEKQRIDGALELEIKTTYLAPSVLPFFGIKDVPITFTRPIFLIDEVDNSEDGSELEETGEGTGTDFGEGGVEDPTDPDDPTCVEVGSNCSQ